MSGEKTTLTTDQPELATGDRAATEGRWRDAIDSWERTMAAAPELRSSVAARLDWFLATHSQAGRHVSHKPVSLIGASLGAALAAIMLVLIAGELASSWSTVLALGAWTLVAVSIVTAIIASRRTGAYSANTFTAIARTITLARRHADRMSQRHDRKQSTK